MTAVTVERLDAARAAAAAAVRVGAGGVTVRMPRLGSVRHGTVAAALRGCPCVPCDRTRDQLAVDSEPAPAVGAGTELVPGAVVSREETTQPVPAPDPGQPARDGWPDDVSTTVRKHAVDRHAGERQNGAGELRAGLGTQRPARPARPAAARTAAAPGPVRAAGLAPEVRPARARLLGWSGVGGDWRDRGLCAQVDTELFFPEKGGSSAEAKRVCVACEVRVECLQYALDNGERFGIWGGLSERERRRLDRQQQPEAVPAAATAAVASGVAS